MPCVRLNDSFKHSPVNLVAHQTIMFLDKQKQAEKFYIRFKHDLIYSDLNLLDTSNTLKFNLSYLSHFHCSGYIPAGNYMFKANNKNTRTRCEICLKLKIKTPERLLLTLSR